MSDQPAGGTDRTAGVVKASSVMAVGTLVSRATGFVAKVVILAFLGFSVTKDSYELANTLPNIIFELLIGGVLASVAIPLLSRARSDPDGGARYTQQLMTLMVVGLTAATALAVAGAPLLTRLYLSSGDNADLALATDLAYLLLPQIFFYGVAALFGAILNTGERFAAPAWAPVVNNLVVIAVGVVLLVTSGTQAGGLTSLTRGQLLLLGLGTTAGIVIQALIMLPALRRSEFRFGWRWGIDTRMREAGALMAWAVAYALVSQVGYVVIVRISKATQDGFYGLYTYGSMLFQLPYGILGVSLLTAIMPRMSRHAAGGDMAAVKRDMSLANRLSSVALLPVTAAMIALAAPLAVVTARYGSVTDDNARILALTLAGFAIGLLPLAITLVQMRVFYAMKDGRTPTVINAIMVAVRIPLLLACLSLPTDWVVPGLALAMSISYIAGVAVGEIWLRARFGQMGTGATLSVVARAGLASAAGGLAAYLVAVRLLGADAGSSLAGAIGQLVLGGAVGLIVVLAVMAALKVPEIAALTRAVQRKLRGNRGTMAATGSPDAPEPDASSGTTMAVERQGQESVTDDNISPDPGSAVPAASSGSDSPSVSAASIAPEPPFQAPAALPAPSAMTLSPGSVVGERYRLSRLIADDAAGNQYWLARDTVLPRDMAVTILPDTAPTSSTVTRTLRAGRLHHRGLPQLLDMGSAGSASYVAGQWVDGATLTELLQAGPLEAAIAARMTAGLADALAEISRAGLALGAVHPSLVRVGMDGQVRLSHLVAQATAATDDDVRAVGALTYLMLTATWPGDPALIPAGIRPAPRRGENEIPASKVVLSASPELSRLAEQALHTTASRGVSLDEIADRARGFGSGGAPRPSRSGRSGTAEDAPARVAGAPREHRSSVAEQTVPARLRTERRWKLSVAGVMLTVLSVLIVIMVGSVVKQLMANIVAPIEAAAHQDLITQPTFSTTRQVAATTTANSPGSSTETSESVAERPITIAGATVYDPQGEPPADYESYVDQAFDGDTGTFWLTWVYRQQFGPGGIKDGVGLMLTLGESVAPKSVTIVSPSPGTVVEIRSAASPAAALDSTTVLGSATMGADPVTINLNDAPESKNLVLWITKLAPYDGDSAKNKGQYQSKISEISVTG